MWGPCGEDWLGGVRARASPWAASCNMQMVKLEVKGVLHPADRGLRRRVQLVLHAQDQT